MFRSLLICLICFLPYASHALNVTATATPTACTPCNGSITATASAGATPYQYSIDGGVTWQSSGSFTGLCATSYTVTARDAMMATATTTVTVVQNAPLSFTATAVNCSAVNLCDGQINVTITGGIPPYTIRVQWLSNTQYFTTSPITGLCPGTYSVTVIDASNNCGLGYTAPIVLTITGTPPPGPGGLMCTTSYSVGACSTMCDNTFYAYGSGGTPPYMYSLNGSPYQSSGTFGWLCEGPNMYTICVRDALMNTWCCQVYYGTNYTYMRTPPPVTASSCTSCTGTIIFSNPQPGEQFYLYYNSVLIAQNNTGSFTGLCAGTYLVNSVYQGCWLIWTLTVPSNPTFSTSITSTNPTCYAGCDGTITCTPTPWSATGYQYSKDNGVTWQTSNVFTGLCAGTYNLRVQDSTGCYGNYSQVITNPPLLPLTLTLSQPNCANGNCYGALICSPTTGPTGPYQWSIDGGINWQTSNQFLNLCAGTYTVIVRDVNGCTRSSAIPLSSTLNQYYASNTRGNPTCANPCGGWINITLGSSNAPVAFNQFTIDSGATWQSTNFYSNLCAGTYYARVRNTLTGCYSPWQTIILSSPIVTMTVSAVNNQASCQNACTGIVTATISVGTNPPYSYSKDGGVTWQSSNIFTGMCTGTYTITAQNSLSCTATQTVVVNALPGITTATSSSATSCYASCDGGLSLTVSPSGSYQFSLDSGATWQTDSAYAALCAGDYMVIIEDSTSCRDTIFTNVAQPDQISMVGTTTGLLCYGDSNGTIQVSSDAINPQYSIDGGITWTTDSSFTNLSSGNYQVIVLDSGGCSDSVSIMFNSPPALTVQITTTNAICGMCNGSVQFNISGGTAPYSYLVSPGNWTTNLCAGVYSVVVTDANGCTESAMFVINNDMPFQIDSVNTLPAIVNQNNGCAIVHVSGSSGPYTFQWDSTAGFQTTDSACGLAPGTYCVTVTDTNGCAMVMCGTVGVITDVGEIQTFYSVYPSPASMTFTISGTYSTVNVALYSSDGRLVMHYGRTSMSPAGQTFALPSEIANGSYIVELIYGDTVFRETLVIVR